MYRLRLFQQFQFISNFAESPEGEIEESDHSEDVALGQVYDPENELYYYNGRYYDPSIGNFTTPDTYVDGSDTLMGFNRYAYVHGNPVKYTDPSGNFIVALAMVVGAAAGAIVGGTGGNVKGWLNGDVQFDAGAAVVGGLIGAVAGATGAWAGVASAEAAIAGGAAGIEAAFAGGTIGGAVGGSINGGLTAAVSNSNIAEGFATGFGMGGLAGAAGGIGAYGLGQLWDISGAGAWFQGTRVGVPHAGLSTDKAYLKAIVQAASNAAANAHQFKHPPGIPGVTSKGPGPVDVLKKVKEWDQKAGAAVNKWAGFDLNWWLAQGAWGTFDAMTMWYGGTRWSPLIRSGLGFAHGGRNYLISQQRMAPHLTGNLARGKSQFLFRINANELVKKAARHADLNGLWNAQGKAKVLFNQPIGIHAGTGRATRVLNLYRTKSNTLHGAPGSP